MMAKWAVGAGTIVALVLSAGKGVADEPAAPSPQPADPPSASPPATTAPSENPPPSPSPVAPTVPPQPAVVPSAGTPPAQQQQATQPIQPPAADPSAYYARLQTQLVPVHIYGVPSHTQYTLDPVVLWPGALKGHCVGNCALQLYPSRYKLTVEGSEIVTGSREIDIRGPSRLQVEPRSRGTRTTGLVLGIVGSAMVLAGYVMIIAGADRADQRGDDGLVLTGILTLVGGAIMTPIGWVKFGRSSPHVTVEPLY